MRIPRHWARSEGEATAPGGGRYRLDVWGWSDVSVADALTRARARVDRIRARVAAGEPLAAYAYGERALREEIIRAIGAPDDPGEAVVTRNRHGVLVLNAAQVPFVDIDLPRPRFGMWGRLWWALRGRPPAAAGDPPGLAAVRAACARHPDWSFRLYQTRAGWRVIVTDRLLDPAAPATRQLLQDLGADPRFVTLCAAQRSFRARLTAKPWRCGCPPPPVRYPYETAAARAAFDAWRERYDAAAARFAACRYVESIGAGHESTAARGVIREHDHGAGADSGRPLA